MAHSVKLDRIDINILAQLQQNARISNTDLADAVSLSPSPCLKRVKRLEWAGYIDGYHAKLNVNKFSDYTTVFTEVTLQDHRRKDFIKFESEIQTFEALQECHLISRGYDYLLKFVAHSVAHYQQIIESVLDRNIGIEKYFSYIVIKPILDDVNIPIRIITGEDDCEFPL